VASQRQRRAGHCTWPAAQSSCAAIQRQTLSFLTAVAWACLVVVESSLPRCVDNARTVRALNGVDMHTRLLRTMRSGRRETPAPVGTCVSGPRPMAAPDCCWAAQGLPFEHCVVLVMHIQALVLPHSPAYPRRPPRALLPLPFLSSMRTPGLPC
jgi:hypothetical protein